RTYHKVIARDVLPFGVRLKRCLAPLHGRFGGRLLSNGSGGRDHQEYGEGDNRETDDDEQDEEQLAEHKPRGRWRGPTGSSLSYGARWLARTSGRKVNVCRDAL